MRGETEVKEIIPLRGSPSGQANIGSVNKTGIDYAKTAEGYSWAIFAYEDNRKCGCWNEQYLFTLYSGRGKDSAIIFHGCPISQYWPMLLA